MGEGSDRNGLYASGDSLSCAEGSTCPQWAQPVQDLVSAALQPVLGVRWRGRLLGPVRTVAELRTPWPCSVYDDAPIGVKLNMAVLIQDLRDALD